MGLIGEIEDFLKSDRADDVLGAGAQDALSLLKRALSTLVILTDAPRPEPHYECAVCAPDPPKPANYEASGGREAWSDERMPYHRARLLANAALNHEASRELLEGARQPPFPYDPPLRGSLGGHSKSSLARATANALIRFADAIRGGT